MTDSGGLAELPPEVLLLICSFLDPVSVVQTFQLVCRHFNSLLSVQYWKARCQTEFLHESHVPEAVVAHPQFGWSRLYCSASRSHPYWQSFVDDAAGSSKYSDPPEAADALAADEVDGRLPGPPYGSIVACPLMNGHYGSVDGLCIVKRGDICITGSRDRNICVWNLHGIGEEMDAGADDCDPVLCGVAHPRQIAVVDNAHQGWIWCITSLDDETIFTGSWDKHIRVWSLGQSDLTQSSDIRCESAILSLHAEPSTLLASTLNRQVKVFDLRNTTQPASCFRPHKSSVLSIAVDGDYIFSSSEDHFVACTDRRNGSVVSRKKMDAFVSSLSLGWNQLWASSGSGRLHLMSPRYGSLDLISATQISDQKLLDVKHTLAYSLSVSRDKKFRVCTNADNPKVIATLGPFNSEPTKLAQCCGTVVCGFGDGVVGVWRPGRSRS